jgi:hypothetical protein
MKYVTLVFLLLLAGVPRPAEAALTFFWRCEASALDATHDFSAGDTSASGSAPTTTAVRIGTNGCESTSNFDTKDFTATSLFPLSTGSFGYWLQYKTALQSGERHFLVLGSSGNNNFSISTVNTNELRFTISNNGAGSVTLDTTAVNLAIDTWYFVVARYDQPNSDRRLEVYNTSLALIEGVEDLSTGFTAPGELGGTFSLGIFQGSADDMWIDNVFGANTYSEPLQSKATITSYTSYSSALLRRRRN